MDLLVAAGALGHLASALANIGKTVSNLVEHLEGWNRGQKK